MRLEPKSPPGNAKRKARAYEGEIKRLRAEGYSIEVIRETLAEAGVVVGWSTVRREAIRPAATEQSRQAASPQPATAPPPPQNLPIPAQRARTVPDLSGIVTAPAGPSLSGKHLAEQFVQGQIGNPLVRKRGNS